MNRYFLLVSMVALIFSARAQEFRPGALMTSANEELEGLVRSDFLPGDETIYFKLDESSDEKAYDAESITKIVMTVDKSLLITFRKEKIRQAYGKSTGPVWLQELIEGPVSLFADTGSGYLMYCNGQFMSLDKDVDFYLKRDTDESASHGGTFNKSVFNVNADRNFIKLTSEFFSDNPGLYSRLRDREFGILELPLVVDIYNSTASSEEPLQ